MGKKKGDPEPEEPAPVEVEAPVEVVEQTGRDQFVFVDGAKYGACADPAHARTCAPSLPQPDCPLPRAILASDALGLFQLCLTR